MYSTNENPKRSRHLQRDKRRGRITSFRNDQLWLLGLIYCGACVGQARAEPPLPIPTSVQVANTDLDPCYQVPVCQEIGRLLFLTNNNLQSQQKMDAWLPHTPVEIALKQQVKHIMDYARKLKAAAKHCRQENDHDCALAFEAKYLFLAQRWTKNFTELPKKLTSEIRVAYLELGRQLLEQGDGTGARRAQELAYQIEPNHADTNELGSKLDEFARAAFLRGYGLYRDQGPGALKSARELWKFAYGSASAGSLIQQKAQQMLSQTAQ